MPHLPAITTAAQLLAAGDIGRCELVRGEVIKYEYGTTEHGMIGARLCRLIGAYLNRSGEGEAFAAGTGFWIEKSPDTVRAPDLAFVFSHRLPECDSDGYFPGPPDMAFEVLERADSASDVMDKTHQWLISGCGRVVVVDPRLRCVYKHTLTGLIRVCRASDGFDGSPVLPDFQFRLRDLFDA